MNVYKYGVEIGSYVKGPKLIAYNSISCMMERYNPEFPSVADNIIVCGHLELLVDRDTYNEVYELYREWLQRS